METTKKNTGQFIFFLYEVSAMITAIICFYKVDSQYKNLLFVLPFGFFFLSFIFHTNFRNIDDDIAKLLIVSLAFVRLVVLSFLYAFNINIKLFEGQSSVEMYFSKACLLMVYEYFVVQLTMWLYGHKKASTHWKAIRITSDFDISKILIVFLALYVLGIAFLMPQYSETFKTIFMLAEEDFTVASTDGAEYSVGTIGRIIKTLFSMSVQLFRILFPAFLIRLCYEHNQKSKLCTLILVVSCVLQFMFLTSTFAEAIVSCLSLVLFYTKLFPKRKKGIFLFLAISTVGMAILYFVVRYFVNNTGLYSRNNGAMAYTAQIINAYFTGVDNVAAIYNISPGHAGESLRAGILGAIPFNSTLFGKRGNKLQFYYNQYNNSYGQIPPTVGTGYYYFGTIFAPVITALFVFLSMRYYKKAEKMDPSLHYVAVVFCCVVFALGTVMYSPAITLAWYFGWGIPMLILTLFDGKKKEKEL